MTDKPPPVMEGLFLGKLKEVEEKEVDVFGGVGDQTPNDWSVQEAFLAILLAAMNADNEVVWQEKEYIQALVRRSKTMKEYINSPEALTAINISVEDRMKSRTDYLGEAVRAMPRDSHKAMFAHCVDIVFADGHMDDKERDFLDRLLEVMEITPDEAKTIVDVIYEKSRY